MTDLQAKFTALEGQLGDQHTAVLAAIADLQTALADLQAALLADSGTSDEAVLAALADLQTTLGQVRDGLYNEATPWLGSIWEQGASMQESTDQIRDGQAALIASLQLVQDMLYPADTPLPDNGYNTVLQAISAIGVLIEQDSYLQARLELLWGTLASVPGENTLLGLLQSLLDALTLNVSATTALVPPQAPNSTNIPGLLTSTGMWLLPISFLNLGTNSIAAVFSGELPSGISYGTLFGFGVDNSELIIATPALWEFYVESSEHQCSIGAGDDYLRYFCNEWFVPLGYDADSSFAFAVRDAGAIRVHIRARSESPDIETTRYISVSSSGETAEASYCEQGSEPLIGTGPYTVEIVSMDFSSPASKLYIFDSPQTGFLTHTSGAAAVLTGTVGESFAFGGTVMYIYAYYGFFNLVIQGEFPDDT